MSKACVGALVKYCGHEGYFLADIHVVAGANVVRATKPVTLDNIIREHVDLAATHHMVDFPVGGYWKPAQGIFVVPEDQVIDLRERVATEKSKNEE